MSLSAKKVIKDYLDGMARKDETFAKAYANKSKNMDSCFNYIVKEARKKDTEKGYEKAQGREQLIRKAFFADCKKYLNEDLKPKKK